MVMRKSLACSASGLKFSRMIFPFRGSIQIGRLLKSGLRGRYEKSRLPLSPKYREALSMGPRLTLSWYAARVNRSTALWISSSFSAGSTGEFGSSSLSMSRGVEGPGVEEAEALLDLAAPVTASKESQHHRHVPRYNYATAYLQRPSS